MSLDKYRRVEKPKTGIEIQENEIRITATGQPRGYIAYATTLFEEKGARQIILKAMGKAIAKTITIVEIIKRRIPGLHQILTIESNKITDVYEPLEEGLTEITNERSVSSITIVLSLDELDTSNVGYQAPLTEEERNAIVLNAKRSKKKKKPKSSPESTPQLGDQQQNPLSSQEPKKEPQQKRKRRRRGNRVTPKGNTNLGTDLKNLTPERSGQPSVQPTNPTPNPPANGNQAVPERSNRGQPNKSRGSFRGKKRGGFRGQNRGPANTNTQTRQPNSQPPAPPATNATNN